ncbi:hypothetical protein CRG98_005526, partial [Punica granatum]
GLEDNRAGAGVYAAVPCSNGDQKGVNLVVPAGAGVWVSSSMDIDREVQDGEAFGLEGGVAPDSVRSADDGARVCSLGESSSGVVSVKQEDICPNSEVKDEGNGQFNDEEGRPSSANYCSSTVNDQYGVQKVEFDIQNPVDSKDHMFEAKSIVAEPKMLKTEREAEPSKSSSIHYKSLMTEFDEYVANERFGLIESGMSRALSFGFEVGDMVWGKVKSHPWWPGHIFNEAFASSSVRRTSRAGHVLVAFFGDSSYGWFDPAELIPFDANFAEKSHQMNSRNFVKAVEEALDEISRRRALGLACKCWNKYNFRPTSIQGYFAVDVPDYEQGVYSETQMKKARDSFSPRETLAFIQQLASVPQGSDQTTIDFIKNRATVFAYRKAVFEEFDETYAQAFGTPATRPSRDTGATDQPVREQTRAPLSGPLVIAETLGGSRSSSKTMKVKDQSKKDKYLFKRRDDSASAAYVEGSDAGGYVLQKRVPSVPLNSQSPGKQEQDQSAVNATLGQDMVGKAATTDGTPAHGSSSTVGGAAEDVKREFLQESQEIKTNIPGLDQVQNSGCLVNSSLTGAKRAVVGADGVVKKKKVVKRPPGELGTQMMNAKKKKRKMLGPEQSSDQQHHRSVTAKAGRPPASKEGIQLDPPKKDDGSSSIVDSVGPLTAGGIENAELELRHLLDGLQHLAVDHFHGVERTNPAIIKQSFLRFRSLVYQKSLIIAPASESDSVEIRPAKSPTVRAPKQSSSEAVRKSLHPKLVKTSLRLDDLSRGGRKRAPSDRQEELEAKKLKSVNKIKMLTAEKKAVQKGQDTRPGEGKETAATAPSSKSVKPVLARRSEPPPPLARAAEPTMLVMKFPPKTSLPSVAHLKARFARFGPLDHNSIRVFWKSSTCRVVFQHKVDAQAACKYAMGNSSPFGNVRCHVRPVDLPGQEGPETNEDSMTETSRSKDPNSERQVAPHYAYQPIPQPQSVQLKSCLKKPPGEEAGSASGNGGKGTARVKFLLGGEENPRQDHPGVGNSTSNNNTNSGSFGDGAGSSSSTSSVGGTIYNSKNFQQKSSLPPLLPLPPQYAIAQQHNNSHHHSEIPPRNQPQPPPNISTPLPALTAATASVDISQQMISLLTRCNDVVTSLSGLLGYVPYHPL